MKQTVYLDNAATTKTAPEVVEAMMPYFTEYYGNPSSVYTFANKSKEAVAEARKQLPEHLEQNRKKYILQPAERNLTTGH